MLPVEVVRSYQDIIWHLLDEIQRLQMERIQLHIQIKELQDRVPPPDVATDREDAGNG